jgi:hypothetical protein
LIEGLSPFPLYGTTSPEASEEYECVMQVVNLAVSHKGKMTETNQEHPLVGENFIKTDTM